MCWIEHVSFLVPRFCKLCGPVLLILIYTSTSFALDPYRRITQYVHDVWTSDQGLPQNSVNALAQTTDGYIWLGTLEGLVRFDGVHFTIFDRKNTSQIRNNRVNALFASTDGGLWIGTEGGLLNYRNGSFVIYTTKNGLISDTVWTIQEDNEHTIWVGTDAGLSSWKKGVFRNYSTEDGLSDNTILSLCQVNDGSIWIGTRKGVNRFSKGRIVPILQGYSVFSKAVRIIYMDTQKRVWIGTENGLFRQNPGDLNSYSKAEGLSNDHILSIVEDHDKNLWVGTRSGGLNRFRDQHFVPFTSKDGLTSDFAAALLEDKEGSLWIGCWGGGLNRLRDGKFVTFTKKEGLGYDSVSSFFETRDGAMWIGSFSGGINRWHQEKFSQFTTRDGLSSNVVCTLLEDSKGALWTGTIHGLNKYQNGKFEVFTTQDGLANDVVYSILEDNEGSLWVGSREGGLTRYRNNIFFRFTPREGLFNDSVYTFLQTEDGAVWIGTKGGLYKFNDEKFTHFSTENGLPHNFITALYEDPRKILWIGTSGGGLTRFKDQKFTVINSSHGLFDDVIYSILEDAHGDTWMTSNKGIFRVSAKALNDIADSKIQNISGVLYGKADGMKLSECNSGQFVSWKTRDQKLWFATLKGAVVVDPDHIPVNKTPPKVLIEKLIVDNQFISLSKPLLISPGKVKFEFHYTALSFFAPDRVLFKYKLEGLDRDWVNANTRRVAYYSNLNRGHYRFHVIACNNDEVWNRDGAFIAFEMQPFFYERVWFYILCGMFIVLTGLIAHHLRLKHLRGRFEAVLAERTRIARDLHDTLAQNLSAMIVQIDAAEKTSKTESERSQQYLDRVRGLAAQALDEIRRTVWKLRPESEQQKDLAQSVTEIANQLSRDSDVSIDVQIQGPAKKISPVSSENLLRIAQQAITNAVQHSSAKSIQVILTFTPNTLVMRITDNGCGFDPSKLEGKGFGLKGMKERALQLHAKLDIISKSGEGTEVIVQLPY